MWQKVLQSLCKIGLHFESTSWRLFARWMYETNTKDSESLYSKSSSIDLSHPHPSTTPTITSKSAFLTPSCTLKLAVPISCFLQISTQPHLWGAFFFYFMIYQLTPLHKTGCCTDVAPPLQNLHHMNSWKLAQSVALCIKHSVEQEVTSYWTLMNIQSVTILQISHFTKEYAPLTGLSQDIFCQPDPLARQLKVWTSEPSFLDCLLVQYDLTLN